MFLYRWSVPSTPTLLSSYFFCLYSLQFEYNLPRCLFACLRLEGRKKFIIFILLWVSWPFCLVLFFFSLGISVMCVIPFDTVSQFLGVLIFCCFIPFSSSFSFENFYLPIFKVTLSFLRYAEYTDELVECIFQFCYCFLIIVSSIFYSFLFS